MGMIGNTPYQGIIQSGNLQDGAVTTSKVADSALTAAKLAAAAITDKLGYTPVNKAGDTLTGNLTVPEWIQLYTDGVGGTQRHGRISGTASANNSYAGGLKLEFYNFNGTAYQFYEGLAVDGAGRVRMPYQPAFSVYKSTAGDVVHNASAVVSASFNASRINTGSHFNHSTGKFTAPVSGCYFFSWELYNNTGAAGARIGLTTSQGGSPLGNGQTALMQHFTGSGIVYLSAGDTAWLYSIYDGAVVYHEASHSVFTGMLIG